MKKLLVLFLIMLLVISTVACGNASIQETEGNTDQEPTETTAGIIDTNSTDPVVETPADLSNWGVEDQITTNDGVNIDRYIIRLPRYTGSYNMYCKISEQLDDTVVLLFGQEADTPNAENISDIFATYKGCTLESIEDLYGIQSSNFRMSIDSSEAVTVGDYEMYVHKGVITYDFDGATRTHQYVAYATKLKDSGNCAYWMVYDFSADQSKGELIAEHALNMAKTFREEQ